MFVAFPPNDGDLVDSSYVMKVWFSKSLADGIDTQTLINRFLIKLASSESGSPANGVAQSRTNYSINYDVTSDYHELAFQLPNLIQRSARFSAYHRCNLHQSGQSDSGSDPVGEGAPGAGDSRRDCYSPGSRFGRQSLCDHSAGRRIADARTARRADPGRNRYERHRCGDQFHDWIRKRHSEPEHFRHAEPEHERNEQVLEFYLEQRERGQLSVCFHRYGPGRHRHGHAKRSGCFPSNRGEWRTVYRP